MTGNCCRKGQLIIIWCLAGSGARSLSWGPGQPWARSRLGESEPVPAAADSGHKSHVCLADCDAAGHPVGSGAVWRTIIMMTVMTAARVYGRGPPAARAGCQSPLSAGLRVTLCFNRRGWAASAGHVVSFICIPLCTFLDFD